jgi:uncharacterized protein (TIGR03437 family)
MKKLPLLTLVFTFTHCVFAQNLKIMNAASLSTVSIAPGSIATIKGDNLTTEVAFATDAAHPPTTLGGVSVTIGGTAAALFYVGPHQINLLVDPATPKGNEAVVVTSGTGTQNGTVTIDPNSPPGLFSLFGTGTRDGAILNAVTFALGDFSTHTADSSTYLALFATGLTSTTPTVTIGGVNVTVTFAGPATCCEGLEQINVQLPASLAGAGRVPVVLTANGQTSNTVQVVLLPDKGTGPFASDEDHGKRSRELSSLASIPGTSLVMSADENDDVIRVIDVKAKKVTQVITLPDGANPNAIAVDSLGKTAVVAESGLGKAAILDLSNMSHVVITQVTTDLGPNAAAIGGTQAVVVNGDVDSVSVIDLNAKTVQKTIPVGHGPEAVAIDATAKLAYVVNEDEGSVSIVDLTGLSVTKTLSLGASVRPESIALVPGTGVAYLTVPAGGSDGQVLELNLTSGATNPVSANPDRSGGSSAVVVFGHNVYFANQTGGSISVLPIKTSGDPNGTITTIKVDLGARALAIDTQDQLLVVSNEGSGTLVLIDLTTGKVTGRINAVQTNLNGDDNDDDHSDRAAAMNLPSISSLSPMSGKAGTSFSLTITGKNFTGATAVVFVNPALAMDEGQGKGASPMGGNDPAFTVTNIAVTPDGSQVTASIAIGASATAGPRLVRVVTPNGTSTFLPSTADMFTVQ